MFSPVLIQSVPDDAVMMSEDPINATGTDGMMMLMTHSPMPDMNMAMMMDRGGNMTKGAEEKGEESE